MHLLRNLAKGLAQLLWAEIPLTLLACLHALKVRDHGGDCDVIDLRPIQVLLVRIFQEHRQTLRSKDDKREMVE